MRKPLIAGNWKMHGTRTQCEALLDAIASSATDVSQVEFAVFPSFVYLSLCKHKLSQTAIRFGAQTVSEHRDGAYTGEVSATMLTDLGCHYVIVGHSERRGIYGETNEQVAKKCDAAFQAGLTPIVCVGETWVERQQGMTLKVVHEQLEVVLLLKDNCANFSKWVVAYEPVWAIGTGQSATPQQAQVVHSAIRAQLRAVSAALADEVRVLYGGSVKPDNAAALFAMPDIDGALVGGASLDAQQFIEIGKATSCNS